MYDIAIIGGGVTGLATAMYSGRLNLKTIVLGSANGSELPIGGTITLTEIVENYPGFIRLTGSELADKLEKHAREYSDYVEIKEETAVGIKNHGDCFTINTKKGTEYQSKTIVFATGTRWRKLTMKGAKELEGRGVHYCALCDGPLTKGKTVAVVGGSDTAAKEALLLAEYASTVYIVYRGGEIRPEPVNAKRVAENSRIKVITNTNIVELVGKERLEKVMLDKEYGGSRKLKLDGVFGAIGTEPISDLAKGLGVATNEKGAIIIDRESNTNIKGVFAAGDVTDSEFKQAVTGVAEGVHAAHSAYRYVKENKFVCTFEDPLYEASGATKR